MSEITREEIDAKLATTEARRDAQIASINGKIDTLNGKIDGLMTYNEVRFSQIEQWLATTNAAISSLKTTTVVTGISSVLAILFGLAGFNAVLLSNMVASFESGKNTSEMVSEVRRQVEATALLLRQAQSERDAHVPPPPSK
jgi:acetaldehyde dehydrogenase (acetylating)